MDYYSSVTPNSGEYYIEYDLGKKEISFYTMKRIYNKANTDLWKDKLSKLLTCPIGDNILDFISIPLEDLNNIRNSIVNNSSDEVNKMLKRLNSLYLCLTYFSYSDHTLRNPYSDKLEYISNEALFALEFCCSVDCNFSLQSLSAMQRYYLYCYLYPDNFHTNNFTLETDKILILEPELVPYEISHLKPFRKDAKLDSFAPITKKFIVPDSVIKKLSTMDIKPVHYYSCSNLSEYIRLEFMKMIELNMKIKRCKNCGKYFFLKGDYPTDYCDRIPKGENNTCKRIASIKARKNKVKDNPILQEYQKAYKRNYARISNRKISNEEFRLWVDESTQKRDTATEQYQNNPDEQIIIDFKEYLGNK